MDDGYTNCSVPGWSGYDPGCLGCVYDAREAEFAKQMGFFWTNLAASGNPNKREKGEGAQAAEVWPAYTKDVDRNIVLKPSPNGFKSERAQGRAEACEFWDNQLV